MTETHPYTQNVSILTKLADIVITVVAYRVQTVLTQYLGHLWDHRKQW